MVQEPKTGRDPSRAVVLVLVAALHVGLAAALLWAFAPDVLRQGAPSVMTAFAVPPPPAPPHPPAPQHAHDRAAGAAAAAGRRAIPQPIAAPPARIAIQPVDLPPIPAIGTADSAGASVSGNGTGAGGAGAGTGSGVAGNGEGAGVAAEPVKIAGGINLASDYPAASRSLRIGDYVIVDITVGVDGAPTACHVERPSRDTSAGPITCQLILQRFRFRPATDAAGHAVQGVYGWKQSWHY